MRIRVPLLALSLALALLFYASPADAQPSAADIEKATKLFNEAETHYKLQEFEEALTKYKEAYRLSYKVELLFNIAQCYRQLGKYEEALRSYKTYLRDDPESPLKKDIDALILELEGLIAKSKTVEAAPPDPTMKPDTMPPPTSDPTTTEPKTTGEPATQESAATPSTPGEDPKDTDKAGASPRLFYGIAGGFLAAGLGVGAFAFSSTMAAKRAQEQDISDIDEVEQKFKQAKMMGAISDVLVVGAVATGAIGFFRQKKSAPKKASLSVSPLGIALSGEF